MIKVCIVLGIGLNQSHTIDQNDHWELMKGPGLGYNYNIDQKDQRYAL